MDPSIKKNNIKSIFGLVPSNASSATTLMTPESRTDMNRPPFRVKTTMLSSRSTTWTDWSTEGTTIYEGTPHMDGLGLAPKTFLLEGRGRTLSTPRPSEKKLYLDSDLNLRDESSSDR